MDVILKALQSIMRGGDDAEDSNIVVSLCEDDQEDSHNKANPASADGNRVPAEEENVVMESEEEAEEEDIVGAFRPISASCFLSNIDSEGPGSSSSSSSAHAAADAAAAAVQWMLYEEVPEEASCSSSSAATKFYEASSSCTTLKASSSFLSLSSSAAAAATATKFYEASSSSTTLKVSPSFQLELSQLLLLKIKRILWLSQLSAEIKKAWGGGVAHFYKTIIVVIVDAVNNEARSNNIQSYGRRRLNS
jgi:hypothetical protein